VFRSLLGVHLHRDERKCRGHALERSVDPERVAATGLG
jgi:hypothetical protein